MVQPNVRASLTRDDAQLALHVIASGRIADLEEGERLLAAEGVDVLLDDPRLLVGLMRTDRGVMASYALVAYVVMRHALTHVGERDRNLADFLASLFMEFGIRDRAQRLSRFDDETYDTMSAILAAADSSDPKRSFMARTHLGNYALWFSGVFPDHIEERRWRKGGPDLEYYESMGRMGYSLASDHRLAKDTGVSDFYALASDRFRVMRIALTSVSDALLFPHSNSPTSIIRRVEDDFRLTS
ncbi:MAG: hypothetical protein M3R65_05130 [Gemmatimonadota bacterium]|nr:hypothetical protein [Gemmatimonadota bacterium]